MKMITSNSSAKQIQNALRSKEPMLFSSDEVTRKKIKEQVDLILIKIRAQRKNAAN